VAVLFCDLRGFSRETERHADDLLGLLQRVSNALGVMTRHIRQQGGVVGDFQGDAAMGFWGWPLPQKDAVLRTCSAALAVRAEFEATEGFHAGIGVATGRADQKVTVFLIGITSAANMHIDRIRPMQPGGSLAVGDRLHHRPREASGDPATRLTVPRPAWPLRGPRGSM